MNSYKPDRISHIFLNMQHIFELWPRDLWGRSKIWPHCTPSTNHAPTHQAPSKSIEPFMRYGPDTIFTYLTFDPVTFDPGQKFYLSAHLLIVLHPHAEFHQNRFLGSGDTARTRNLHRRTVGRTSAEPLCIAKKNIFFARQKSINCGLHSPA